MTRPRLVMSLIPAVLAAWFASATASASPTTDAAIAPPTPLIVFDGPGTVSREIFVMAADGSGRTLLTDNTVRDTQPAWSPNGRKIVFVRHVAHEGDDLFVMQADGTHQRALTSGRWNDVHPSWSYTGGLIAFASDRSGTYQIYTVKADGTALTQLTHRANDATSPRWDPRCIPAWCTYPGAVVFASGPPGEQNLRWIAGDGSNSGTFATTPGSNSDPGFSSDNNGGGMFFVSDRTGTAQVFHVGGDFAGGVETQISSDSVPVTSPGSALGEDLYLEVRHALGPDDGIYVGDDPSLVVGPFAMPTLTHIGTSGDRHPLFALPSPDSVAEVNLLRSLSVADQISGGGDYAGVSIVTLSDAFPSFDYTSLASNGPHLISVGVSGSASETIGMAALSWNPKTAAPSACLYLQATSGVVTYGRDASAAAVADCTWSDAATEATDPTW